MNMTRLSHNVFAGAQIAPEDLATLVREGFTDVVCNRPDAEHPGGPVSATMSAAARARGLRFHYLPVTPGGSFAEAAAGLSRIAAGQGAKVFAYCRSGARSANAWSLAGEPAAVAD